MKAKLVALCAFLFVGPLASRAADENDIIDTLASSKEHTILVTAVREAGLLERLKEKGPFTLFAPTDAAFKKLGEDKIKEVVKNKELLKKVILAHVVEDKAVYHKELLTLDGKDVNGFKIAVSGKTVTIGDAKITKPDLKASNGVIHVVDTVLIPTK